MSAYVYVCKKPHQPRPKRAIQPAAFNGPQPRHAGLNWPPRVKNSPRLYVVLHFWRAIEKKGGSVLQGPFFGRGDQEPSGGIHLCLVIAHSGGPKHNG